MTRIRLILLIALFGLVGLGAVAIWSGNASDQAPVLAESEGGLFGGNVAPGQEPPIAHMPAPEPVIAFEPEALPAPAAEPEAIVIGEPTTRSLAENQTHIDVPVYFATNRALNPDPDRDDPADQFLDQDGDLVWGDAVVSIPRVHELGVLESQGWWASMFFDPDPEKHVILQSMTPGDLAVIRDWVLRDLETQENAILMYVHGYNTSLDKAMRRAGQLTYDLGWQGPSFLFSWPSQGDALDYFKDSTLAQRSTFAMRDTLAELASLEADRIVIIAHSMGTRVLSNGLAELARDDLDAANRISTVILAAPDIDESVFRDQLAPRFQSLSGSHFTLYASAEDSALKVSKSANGFPRIGDTTGGVPDLPGIDVIDATGVVSDFFGHTYFGDNKTILSDIFTMVHQGLPIDQRPLVKQVDLAGRPVWKIVVD